jgi:hypothetical protein
MGFFFNQLNGKLKPDDEGTECATVNDARIEAVRYASEVMREHPTLIWTGQDFRIEVTNAEKLLLFTVVVVGVDAPAGVGLE